MAEFTVRVVLHDKATWDDYETLAAALAEKNITDVLTSDDGVKYKMPPAEYQCRGDITKADVLTHCRNAAGSTGKKYSVLVTESNGRTWVGLDTV